VARKDQLACEVTNLQSPPLQAMTTGN